MLRQTVKHIAYSDVFFYLGAAKCFTSQSSSTPTPPTDAAPKQPKVAEKAKEIVKTLLHGTEEIKHLDELRQAIEARGNMMRVFEMQTHHVKPKACNDYKTLILKYFPHLNHTAMRLHGSWQVDVGDQDQFIHIWQYDGYQDYERIVCGLTKNTMHQQFLGQLLPLLRYRSNQLMQEFVFQHTRQGAACEQDGIYELQSHCLEPGQLLEWELYWRRGLATKKTHCELVGAWFSQLGDLNQVHHMWYHRDFQSRYEMREGTLLGEDQTVGSVATTAMPRIHNAKAQILKPMLPKV